MFQGHSWRTLPYISLTFCHLILLGNNSVVFLAWQNSTESSEPISAGQRMKVFLPGVSVVSGNDTSKNSDKCQQETKVHDDFRNRSFSIAKCIEIKKYTYFFQFWNCHLFWNTLSKPCVKPAPWNFLPPFQVFCLSFLKPCILAHPAPPTQASQLSPRTPPHHALRGKGGVGRPGWHKVSTTWGNSEDIQPSWWLNQPLWKILQ